MHTRGGQLSVGVAPAPRPSVAINVRSTGPTTVAQVESTSMLEPPYGISETCVEGNDQHGTRDAAAAMHRRFNLIPGAAAPRRFPSQCGVWCGAEAPHRAISLWVLMRPFILAIHSFSAALKSGVHMLETTRPTGRRRDSRVALHTRHHKTPPNRGRY